MRLQDSLDRLVPVRTKSQGEFVQGRDHVTPRGQLKPHQGILGRLPLDPYILPHLNHPPPRCSSLYAISTSDGTGAHRVIVRMVELSRGLTGRPEGCSCSGIPLSGSHGSNWS